MLGLQVGEVRMLQGLLHRYPPSGIKGYQLQAEVEGGFVEVLEIGFWVDRLELGECMLEVGKFV